MIYAHHYKLVNANGAGILFKEPLKHISGSDCRDMIITLIFIQEIICLWPLELLEFQVKAQRKFLQCGPVELMAKAHIFYMSLIRRLHGLSYTKNF